MHSEKIKKQILNKINTGEVEMRPRWHFVLETVLVMSGVILVTMGLLYVLSFIVFFLRQSGLAFAPSFGIRGIVVFLYSSPWLLILSALVFLLALEILVRKYSFGYRTPLLYMLLGIVGVSLLGTYLISQTTMHARLQMLVQDTNIPVMRPLYQHYGMHEFSNLHIGSILEVTDDGFLLENRRGKIWDVYLTNDTRTPPGFVFEVGTTVGVIGEIENKKIVADGIQVVPAEALHHMNAPMMDTHRLPPPEVRGKWKKMK